MNPHTYGQLIYDKGNKNKQWRKAVSSISGVEKIGELHVNDVIRTFSNTTYKNKLKMD